jgi:hypothetical protein
MTCTTSRSGPPTGAAAEPRAPGLAARTAVPPHSARVDRGPDAGPACGPAGPSQPLPISGYPTGLHGPAQRLTSIPGPSEPTTGPSPGRPAAAAGQHTKPLAWRGRRLPGPADTALGRRDARRAVGPRVSPASPRPSRRSRVTAERHEALSAYRLQCLFMPQQSTSTGPLYMPARAGSGHEGGTTVRAARDRMAGILTAFDERFSDGGGAGEGAPDQCDGT